MKRADARTAMIDAAEAIVAERGLAAMSLREVQARAGQLNKNAAQYHFGNREGLIAAVVEARMAPINDRRWRMLAELDAASPRQLVEALISPLAHAVFSHPGSRYARFLAQAAFDPQLSSMITGHIRAGSAREALNRLVGSASIPADLESSRILGVFIATITTLAHWEASPELFADPAALVVDLVDTTTAALLAPSSRPADNQLSDQPA